MYNGHKPREKPKARKEIDIMFELSLGMLQLALMLITVALPIGAVCVVIADNKQAKKNAAKWRKMVQ